MKLTRITLSLLCCLCVSGTALAAGGLDKERPLVATTDIVPMKEGPLGVVDVAPYDGVFPLTAIINKANHNISKVKVTVLGKGDKGIPISYDVGPQAINTHNGIPVFGLYPDYVNKVKVDWEEGGKPQTYTWSVYAAPVTVPATGGQTAALPTVEPVKVDGSLKNRLYLFNHIVGTSKNGHIMHVKGGAANWDYTGINWISDTNGDVRWFMNIDKLRNPNDITRIGSMMSFHQVKDGNLIFGQGQRYYKYDFLGRNIADKRLPKGFIDFSHEIIETPNDTYLLRVAKEDYPLKDGYTVNTVRDHILEVDKNGDTVDYWDLNTILDPFRDNVLLAMDQGAVCLSVDTAHSGETMTKEQLAQLPFGDVTGSGPGRNWAHVNSISYDARDDSIIISSRHQSAVIKIGRDKQVKWIIADPTGWKGELAKKVLKPVDKSGKALKCENHKCEGDFDWTWTQHTGYIVPSKSTNGKSVVTVFDNGDARGMEQPALPTMKYSRGVEFVVDEKNMTVYQSWEYGKERGFEWYSPITSVTQYRPETKTMFMYSATAGMSGTTPLVSVLNEVKDGTQDVMLELKVHSNRPTMLGYRSSIIDPTVMFKK
ncbi:arylsulfatase [Leminorella grimontii]|uniref:Arylsulfatase n=1 Tax=Leminorella grimontii TaxID=82981 RepID=A0AAV5N9L6_9GAMM|nr:aryl-sulfate sulfotransferase [Leminorella grimontii]KFC94249.1 putative arylsulfate sulfotransferase [Leminorella grimontii ATCC 33999 = DSM 5078]GKX57586.1 arylsulfatase [Leminorella grimontii]GKX60029.1 arylsulfatase [Leminorella grimontii]VFS54681.1 Arylsulfotransferase (ASST) [Leminorella grimontii]